MSQEQSNDYLVYIQLQEPFTYAQCVAAARNEAISTDDLVQFALKGIQDERAGDTESQNRALLVLQQRVTQEVFDRVETMCQSTDPAERQLGVMILREFPGLDFEKPFKYAALNILEQLAMNEADEAVLAWGVSAIGWQMDPKAIPLLLQFVDHPSEWVRFMVADNLLLNCTAADPFPSEIAQAYQKLCIDPDVDIRWYSFATFAEVAEDDHWSLRTESQKQDFLALLKIGLQDKDPEVRTQARNAMRFFNAKQDAMVR